MWMDLLLRVCLMLREFEGLCIRALCRSRYARRSLELDFLPGMGCKVKEYIIMDINTNTYYYVPSYSLTLENLKLKTHHAERKDENI